MSVRVRFAPSPTGYLHVGGARTALFDYLFARHCGGTFVLRIEDTDRSRYDPRAADEIFESLEWLGIVADEGPRQGGAYGPYVQSQRLELYREQIERLLETNRAYRCFCSPQRLAQVRERLQGEKKNLGYDGHCRSLDECEVAGLVSAGTPHVVRLAVPGGETVSFVDEVRGETIQYRSDLLDDMILLKSDGFPTYHFASVVDDHLMKITHVFRGEEWIASTPSHVLLYRALGWVPPRFAHLPVILSSEGGKLSKRKGAASVMDFKRAGYLPDALFNFLALIGWNPGDDRELMSREEIVAAFTLERISPKSGVFDEKKLEWMNGHYLAHAPDELLVSQCLQTWREKGYVARDAGADDPYLLAVAGLLKQRSKRVVELADSAAPFFVDPETYDEKGVRKHFREGARDVLLALAARLENCCEWSAAALEESYRDYAVSCDMSAAKLIHPTRLAISGVTFGPGLFEMMELMGRERVAGRMKRGADWIASTAPASPECES